MRPLSTVVFLFLRPWHLCLAGVLLLALHLGLDTHESLVFDLQEFLVHLTESDTNPSLRGHTTGSVSPDCFVILRSPSYFARSSFPFITFHFPFLPFPRH